MVAEILLFLILLIATIQDIKTRSISLWLLLLGNFISLTSRLFIDECIEINHLISVIPILLLFCVSYFGKEAIGYGDIAIFLMTSLVMGFFRGLELILFSMIINAIYGGVLIICRRKKLKDKVAFVPSIFLAYTILMIVQHTG